jgi:hypothetical protein
VGCCSYKLISCWDQFPNELKLELDFESCNKTQVLQMSVPYNSYLEL